MIRRLIALTLLLSCFGCASMDDADRQEKQTPRARYGGDVGEYPVGVIPQAILHDATRNKDLELSVEYPIAAGMYPLIVFSPEFGSSSRSYVGLTSYWASEGYVVVKVQHADAARNGAVTNGSRGWQDQTAAERTNRVRDLTFVIDALDQLTTHFPELQGKIDKTKIGAGGHGYGAFTALMAAGMRTFPGGTASADARIKAVVAMSPQGPSEALGLTRESWSELKIPALFMTGSKEAGRTEAENAAWREQPFELAAAGDKWLMVIENGTSSAFTGEAGPLVARATDQEDIMNRDPLGDPRDPRNDPSRIDPRAQRASGMAMMSRNQFVTVKLGSLAFWDTYLRGDAKGRETLEQMSSRSGVELRKR